MSAIGISFGGASASLQMGAARASGPGASATLVAGAQSAGTGTAASVVPANDALATHSPLDAGGVPVDAARVAAIKKAIQNNSYPLNPARIGDAMIAAGLLLRIAP